MTTEGAGRAGCASGDDEEWLYGENDEEDDANPAVDNDDEKTETEVFSALVGEVEDVNGTASQEGDEESDSDSDDDDEVCVTIGNIKRGSSQSISSSTPVSFNIKASSRSTSSARGVDLDASGSISGASVLEPGEESFEEKPWRKPGADLSDYFNYGFGEDTWKVYCDKQRRMRMSLEVMTLGSSSKTMVNYDRGNCPSVLDSSTRKTDTSINVTPGQTGTISRVEGRRRAEENDTNVGVQSSDAEFQSTKPHPFLPLNIPPPPFPPFPISTTPSVIPPPPRLPIRVPPPGFPIPPGAPSPPSAIPTLDSSRSGGSYDGRSAHSYPFSAGVFPPVLGSVGSWLDLMDSAKASKYYSHHDKKRERVRDREREWTRDRERERERNRERQRDREHTPACQGRSSDEECVMRHRDHSDRERERHRERSGRAEEREDRYRERRHREHSERHKPSRSSYSRRRHASDAEESHRRHRHKRSRRTRESTEPSEEHSAEHDNQSEAT
ncbi:pre-mRNA 3'-end-processing factor FIP1 isoform X1, partial [Astyanax mexicanus]